MVQEAGDGNLRRKDEVFEETEELQSSQRTKDGSGGVKEDV